MKQLMIATVVLSLFGTVFADELTLKDGRTIEWSAIRDLGDTYEVESPNGSKSTVKKDDVESFRKTKAAAPLTGATFTFEKGIKLEHVDLLQTVDPKAGIIFGDWKQIPGGGWQGRQDGSVQTWARLQTGYQVLKPEYDLSLQIQRTEGETCFLLGFVAGGGQRIVLFDWQNQWNGFFMLDKKWPETNESGVRREVFKKGKTVQVTLKVRKIGVAIEVDGKDLIVWSGDWERITIPMERHTVPDKNVTYFGFYHHTGFKILRAILSQPKEK